MRIKILRGLAAVPLLALIGLGTSAIPSPAASMVTTGGASVNGTTVTFNGIVNDNSMVTNYQFLYGVGASLNQSTPQTSLPAIGGDQNVPATVTGLIPVTTYSFELQADIGGTVMTGMMVTFMTGTATVTPTPTPTSTVTVTPTPTATGTVLGCTDALVAFARTRDATMTQSVALAEAALLAACQGLSTTQLAEAAANALVILGTGPTPTATITVPVTVPVTTPVFIPVGAPGTGGGTGPETGIIAMAVTGGIALAGGGVLLARRLRRKQ